MPFILLILHMKNSYLKPYFLQRIIVSHLKPENHYNEIEMIIWKHHY